MPENCLMHMTTSNYEAQKRFIGKMSDEERREYYRNRYLKNKGRYNKQSSAWSKSNPHKAQASTHQTQIAKKYPKAFADADFTTAELAGWLLENRGKPCTYCGQPATHIDHVTPLSRGGVHQWSNLVLACKVCNFMKQDLTVDEFLAHVRVVLDYN